MRETISAAWCCLSAGAAMPAPWPWGGMVTAGYTVPEAGAAPALGWSGLSADGEGGVQADADGSTHLVVDVDTTAKTVTFVL